MPPRNPPPHEGNSAENNRRGAIHLKLARTADHAPMGPLPSGFETLDASIGGGFPRGRIVEIFGPPASGKTTLALEVAANLQRAGSTVAWIDADRTFDPAYAAARGVVLEGFPVAQPESAESAMGMIRRLAESHAVDLVIVDSAAALTPSLELEAGIGSHSPGLYARVLAAGLRTLAGVALRSRVTLLLLNPSREDGVAGGGGAPLKLHSWVRIGLSASGSRVWFRIVKNKVGGGTSEGEIHL